MANTQYSKKKLYKRVYNYSKKHRSYKLLGKVAIPLSPQKLLEYITALGLNILFGILIFFSVDLLKAYPDKTPFYLLFLIIVAFSAILGGLKSALFTTGIISLEAYLLFRGFYNTSLDITLYIQLASFIAGAIIISILVYLIKEDGEVKKLKEREKMYARTFIKLHDEHTIALQNIQARDEFLSIVSHELKTPLTVMLLKLHGELNNIRSASLANFSVSKLMKVLKNSEQQIEWLKSMINDLLDVSLITTGRMNLQPEDTDLVTITNQVTQSFSEMLKRKKYKIKINASTPVVGKWDKVRIEQAITNLVSNATKYGNGKPIEISIFKSGNQAKFIIKDQGIGIPTSEQKVIFDLFKRASGPGEYKKGLGVGLFITSQIVKIHGGRIKVSSVPVKGASFTVELPLRNK
ncbi:MAG: HAMP domain-containing sensor histidine kinase [Candidatus Curtissbacteria bacterium]|nr:HAMP domain-containing sensor histidine kinase [Candidatus Curtissbacteria bacterium]